eukprot:Nitzschia sp. Nitz4//scaffold44_size153857//48705//50223//NITZ4_002711-RA/size153857-augustus-gene-0.18-mRNA-1//-1//CDS//3329552127//6162//frame0
MVEKESVSTLLSNEKFATLRAREEGLLSAQEVIDAAGLATDRLPSSEDEAVVAHDLLSNDLNKLSLDEQEKLIFEVHGLPQPRFDDPENIDELLLELERQILLIGNREAYDHAKYLNPDYVSSRFFRLMFLRGDFFDVKLAAERIVYHFEMKQHLFGKGEILGRDVRISDLNEDDMGALESGFIQLLPSRDVSGRLVVLVAPTLRPVADGIAGQLRVTWFFVMHCLRRDDDQKAGAVMVFLNTGKGARKEDIDTFDAFSTVKAGLPRRIVAAHYCFCNEAMKPYVVGLQLAIDQEVRKRLRVHFGTPTEISHKLQTFGIPMKCGPMDDRGNISTETHIQWVQAELTRDKLELRPQPRTVPLRFDVLLGRGIAAREHTGNLRASHLVEMHESEYEQASKTEKTAIAKTIIQKIHDSHGRFLKWEEGGWEEVDPDVALKKIGHYFRQLRSKRLEGSAPGETLQEKEQARVKRVTPSSSPSRLDE